MQQFNNFPEMGQFQWVSNRWDVPNQCVIYFDNGVILQSYESIIVVRAHGQTYIGPDYDFSRTTGRYRNDFLGEKKEETEKKIKSGEYIMLELLPH